jgi:nucleotidyltransferase/DNA polymerase involved in DNA repair
VILCARIPEIPIAALVLRQPELRRRPLVVGGHPSERKPVRAASLEAQTFGVCPEMPLRQAEQLCPEALFFPVDLEAEQDLARHLLAGLYALAPRVELAPQSGEGYIELDGMALLAVGRRDGGDDSLLDYAARVGDYLERRLGTRPGLGIGGNKFVAFTAAGLHIAGNTPRLVARGSERSFLAPLPIAVHLPVSDDLIERLRLFGLRAMADLAAMPLAAVETQFGGEGLLALRLARGEDSRPLIPWQPPQRMEELSRLDPAVDNLEPLLFLARGLVDRLGARLLDAGLAATVVRLCLELEDEAPESAAVVDLRLRAPMSSAADLWTPVSDLIRRQPVRRAVSALRLRLSGFCPARSRQLDLLTRRDGRVEDIARQLALLADAHGPGLVRVPALVEVPPLLDQRRHRWTDAAAAMAGAAR